MSLSPGTHIGPYEVTGTLGAGGMGEVYRARDSRLNRDVALKVLPEAFADDAERLARFEREAQVLAALKHPNIASIYGLEDSVSGPSGQGVTRALVLELVEGETLAERIARGRIPADEALPLARRIAEALQAAHDQGVVHRDLKPANVKIQPDGVVKVLDFGLAKLTEAGGATVTVGNAGKGALAALSQSPTLTSPAMMTGAGVILGTAAYMAPEQAKGRPADKRSDVWAFGCVLYEMLTAKRAFEGDDVSDTLASVLKGDPNWSVLPAGVPPLVRTFLESCLRKDRNERIGDLAAARFVLDHPLGVGEAPVVAKGVGRRQRLTVAAVSAVATALIVGGAAWFATRPVPSTDVVRFSVNVPTGTRFTGAAKASAISPDGRRLLMLVVRPGGEGTLWVQAFDSMEPQELAGTENALNPVWSPNGREIAFFAGGRLRKIDAAGGPVQELCDASAGGGGGTGAAALGIAWSPGGYLVFGTTPGILMRVSEHGGSCKPLSSLDSSNGETNHAWPSFLPDGRHFLYIALNRERAKSEVFVADVESSERRRVMTNDAEVMFAEPGYLLFLRGTALMAQRFDPDTFELTGDVTRIVDEVARLGNGATTYSVSSGGVLTYRPTLGAGDTQVTWFDRQGQQATVQDLQPGAYAHLEISRDGRSFTFTRADDRANFDIWLHDIERGITSRLTSTPESEFAPRWSPDGRYVAFTSTRGVSRKLADGSGEEEVLAAANSVVNLRTTDWSADGRAILYSATGRLQDLWILPTDGDRKARPFLQTEFSEREARFSPDGRWVAYSSDQSGQFEIYVRSATAPEGQQQISRGGGVQPRWSADGQELFYLTVDGRIMTVPLERGGESIRASVPRQLFDTQTAVLVTAFTGSRNDYAVTADGQRFLAITAGQDGELRPTYVVLNWPALLDR